MEYHYINNEDESLVYDIEHNDSDDELINVFLLINKYGDFVNKDIIDKKDITAIKRTVMMFYERYAEHLEKVLRQYVYWLFEYKYDTIIKQAVDHIALLYHYCRCLNIDYYAGCSFFTNEVEDVTYNNFIQTILSYDTLHSIIKDTSLIYKVDIDKDCFINELSYDNLLDIDWLTSFLESNAVDISSTQHEIELHKEELDNYVY